MTVEIDNVKLIIGTTGIIPYQWVKSLTNVNDKHIINLDSQKLTRLSGSLSVFGLDIVSNNMGTKLMDYQLRMSERLVILSKLGSGASSTVYKAIDLMNMR